MIIGDVVELFYIQFAMGNRMTLLNKDIIIGTRFTI